MTRLIAHLRRLADARGGTAGIELALVAPILLTLIFTSFAIFGSIKASYVAEKSTFTVADLISRQTAANDELLKQLASTLARLNKGSEGLPQLRISSIIREPTGFKVDWTYNSSDGTLSKTALPMDALPDVAINDSLMLTETVVVAKSAFAIVPLTSSGLMTFENVTTTRPRFVGRVARN